MAVTTKIRKEDEEEDSEDARTLFCANLSERVTDALLYELFQQAGPVQKVSIPKDKDGAQRSFGFITYQHVESVQYAMNIFAGTRLFNRDLRLNNRNPNNKNPSVQQSPKQRLQQQQQQQPQLQQQQQQFLQHQMLLLQQEQQNQLQNDMQMQMRQFLSTCNQPLLTADLSALHSGNLGNTNLNASGSMQPKVNTPPTKRNDIPSLFDTNALLGFGAQMLQGTSALSPQMLGGNPNGSDASTNNHQSKISHRHENRPHHRNMNYSNRNVFDRRSNEHDRRDHDRKDSRDRGRDRDRDRDYDRERMDRAYERLDKERQRDRDYNKKNRHDRRN